LSSEQVNLALVDDIAKMTQQAVSISKELQDSTDMADKLQNELNLQIQKVKKLYPQASKFQDAEDKLWDKATKAASDLGIDRNSIKGFKEFSD
jgi:septal ring factor EnvC (AmiA/AmiB activator)